MIISHDSELTFTNWRLDNLRPQRAIRETRTICHQELVSSIHLSLSRKRLFITYH